MEVQGDRPMPISDSKFINEKRRSCELGEKSEVNRKRRKTRDIGSVLTSLETNTLLGKEKEASDKFKFGEDMSQVKDVTLTLDLEASRAERSGKTTLSVEVNPVPIALDLNSEAHIANDSTTRGGSECVEKCDKGSLAKMHSSKCDKKCTTSGGGIDLDLNAEDVTSSVNNDPFHPYKIQDHSKPRDVSECASTTGPVEEKDPLRVWKEMKQNGFLSSSHGGISIQSGFSSFHGGTPVPKQRGRKPRNDVLKKRIELAKKEQVDRFTKIAAPSGLLTDLNPGIINHVRNKKQVHSIIEALVRSEKLGNGHVESKKPSRLKCDIKETSNMNDSEMHRLRCSLGFGRSTALSGSEQAEGSPILTGQGDTSMVDRMCGRNSVSNLTALGEDDTLALKLSSSTKLSKQSSTFSNGQSTNIANVASLSVRAATVASQWLELLHEDIKGRLSALRRSKKRVQAVMTTELPFLLSKEFSSNQENDLYIAKNFADGLCSNATAALHHARWSTLFDQMDKALSEEERQLESWLNQVKEKRLHCDHGRQHIHLDTVLGFQQQGISENCTRPSKADSTERELATRAAAASIYSTCNFLMSKENVSCF